MRLPFPPISPFVELIQQTELDPKKFVVRDHSTGETATAGQLLHIVSLFRDKLQAALLQNGTYDTKNASEERFIFLLAPPGLQYVVAMLTIFSLGAGMSAQSIVIRPEDMIRFFKLSNPIALLYAPALTEKVEAIKALCAKSDSGMIPRIPFLEIQTASSEGLASHTYTLAPITEPPSYRTGSLFFTSGTSGNQKGVVHSYKALLASAQERIETWKLTENDTILAHKPGNWMGGFFGIIPSLISGACLETCAGVFSPKWFWERIGQGGLTVFDISPTGYDRLAQYFDDHIAVLPPAQKELYIGEIIAVKVAGVTGSLLPPHTQERWTGLRRGKPLLNLYGSTEVTLICSMQFENPKYIDMCSVGPAVPGVEVKLVDGEMHVKAPSMFSRYISDDPTQTEKAFDSEGFFKTGDCAEKLGDSYTLHVLHFWGFTLHTGEIESALFSLPYIDNAVVLPIEDEKYQERAAAILRIKPAFHSTQPGLDTLRKDLTEKTGLFLFKQPTVVYWLQEGEDIPLTASGKVSKRDARNEFFGDGWRCKESVEVLDLKDMEYWRLGGQC